MTDREGLVEWLMNKSCKGRECPDVRCGECDGLFIFRDDAEKVADHILADGWTRLPCKVGDTLYTVANRKDRGKTIVEVKVLVITFDRVKTVGVEAGKDYGMIYDLFRFDEFGKTIFPTREEAENALRDGCEAVLGTTISKKSIMAGIRSAIQSWNNGRLKGGESDA